MRRRNYRDRLGGRPGTVSWLPSPDRCLADIEADPRNHHS
ncbi:hypothetical protein SCATT_42810 [Streptantibioticus cattleyicolor NRRL 8057 = DSM 46488]|uniref:Uncharacterized protein n=1 Tax=Streptantibioticus cattleyicolor (strain ATCC 35852 / DSM 46488 / JCM 4925 / NBRC 14057 / NRRL 8057) TaxID=1003195 RepID=G8WSU6_STREN|nr:hypothetical protein SCATT_42810 [Streptantibioticus cattleyicolor NRRL 8057 = DSM 46488]